MSLSNFSKIVTNGLVFYYDMSNRKKSWIGAPTTNLLVSQGLGYSLYAYVTGPVVTPTSDQNNVVVPAQRYTISTVINTARAAFYPSSLTTGVNYVFSCYIRYNGNNVAVPSLYADASKGNPEGGANNNTFNSTSVTATPVGNNWYYLVYKFNYATCPTNRCVLAFGVSTGSDTAYLNNTFDVYNAQLEIGTLATPYANGVRSSTQAMLDLTGQRTITAQEVTYDADGLHSFNNVANWCEISTLPAQTNAPLSVFAWVYLNATPAGTNGIWGHYSPFSVNAHFEMYASTSRVRLGDINNSALPALPVGVWVNTGFTSTGQNHYYYVNGVLQASWSGPTGTLFGANTHMMGRSDAGRTWNGKIGTLKVYNKFLTEKEIRDNFNALRGRYGL
jgi:hypothetical protein